MAFQGDSIYWVEVEKVVPNPFQPRRDFDESKLQELSESIRMYGVLQPLTVTRREVQRDDGTFYSEYELIAGERRLRASKLAGLLQVPVIIREGDESEQEKLELAIIENLQREDLNAIDRAIAFKQLCDQFGLSHSQVAKKVGRSREYVSNSVRLLGLPEYVQQALKRAELSEGHARTLLMLVDRPEEQEVIFREIVLKKMSVRETERIIRKIATDRVRKKDSIEFNATLLELEKKFTETLGTRVQIQKTDFGGKLMIDYFSEDDLASILNRIKEDEQYTLPSEALRRLVSHTPLSTADDTLSQVDNGVFKQYVFDNQRLTEERNSSEMESVFKESNDLTGREDNALTTAESDFDDLNSLARQESDYNLLPDEEVVINNQEVRIDDFLSADDVNDNLTRHGVASAPTRFSDADYGVVQDQSISSIMSELSALIDQVDRSYSQNPTHYVSNELSTEQTDVREVSVAEDEGEGGFLAQSEDDVPAESEMGRSDSTDSDDSDLYSIRRFTV